MKVIEYAPRYKVDEAGTVYGTRGILKPRDVGYIGNGTCYQQVALYHENKRINKYVHVLVAEHFLGGVPEGMQVNHIDGNKANNHVTNLEFVSCHENMKHAAATGLINIRGDNHPARKKALGIKQKRLTKVQLEGATTSLRA